MVLDIIGVLNDFLWTKVMMWLLLAVGIFYTLRLGFPQIFYFGRMCKVLMRSRKASHNGISSFQALCTSIAAGVGTGNLAGVATALYAGGPGAIFWMWITAILGMATGFTESVLAQIFRVEGEDGTYRGGPAYYMQRGLGKRWMGVLFAALLIIAMGMVFEAVQSNSIAASLNYAFGFDKFWVGIVLAVLAGLVIFGGIRRIARVAEFVVPFMAVFYVGVTILVMLWHFGDLPGIFKLIIDSAFDLKSVAGGGLGFTIAQAFRYGVSRGLFSNEAGMGSFPNVAASADVNHPVTQGLVQMFGVFVDTILICSATATFILLSDSMGSRFTGVELTQAATSDILGQWGPVFIASATFFFAFTTILANCFYAETNLRFIRNSEVLVNVYRGLMLCWVVFGAVTEVPVIWQMADLFNGSMALVNLVALVFLSKYVLHAFDDYKKQVKAGVDDPIYDYSNPK